MSFVEQLLTKHADRLSLACNHALTKEMCAGTLPDHVLYTYLRQDLQFFQQGLNIFGRALAGCNHPEAAITLGKQIGFICNDENDYFFKVLHELEPIAQKWVPEMISDTPPLLAAASQYNDFMASLETYPEIITFMYVMEKVYLDWAELTPIAADLAYKHKQWIVLHSGEAFSSWTDFLKSEVDRVVTEQTKSLCEKVFLRTLDLEFGFFDDCYRYSKGQ